MEQLRQSPLALAAVAALLAVMAGCEEPRAAPAKPVPAAAAAYPEALTDCSPTPPPTRKRVIETRVDRCGPDRAAPLVRRLDELGASDGWLQLVATDEDIAALRGLGCATAVLCTDPNAWAIVIERTPPEKLSALVLEARARATPHLSDVPEPK